MLYAVAALTAIAFSPSAPLGAARQSVSPSATVMSAIDGTPSRVDRRAALGGLLGAAAATVGSLGAPLSASAKVDSVNPANNYYFPMAKYRYLPRIFRAWIAVDQLAPAALEVGDWEGMEEVVRRLDDATTALPLYTNAVEGSRSTKRKKKSDTQKQMTKDLKAYTAAIEQLQKAAQKKDRTKASKAIAEARENLLDYRVLAKIDGEDGGVIQMPLGNAEEVSSATMTSAAAPTAATRSLVPLPRASCRRPHPIASPLGRARATGWTCWCPSRLRRPCFPWRRRQYGLRAATRRCAPRDRSRSVRAAPCSRCAPWPPLLGARVWSPVGAVRARARRTEPLIAPPGRHALERRALGTEPHALWPTPFCVPRRADDDQRHHQQGVP